MPVPENETRILFCILDGLGGLPRHRTLRSELEQADVGNLDRLAARSEVGLTIPVAGSVTPGPLDGYLALLGVGPGAQRGGSFGERWGLRAAAFAAPESGLARATARVGIAQYEVSGPLADRVAVVKEHWDEADCHFLGFEATGDAGLAGDFERKCRALREFDLQVPELLGLGADVFVVAGDRTIPALLGQPTWHPTPFLVHSQYCREGNAANFNEQECLKGSLGVFPALDVMPLVMAHALRPVQLGE